MRIAPWTIGYNRLNSKVNPSARIAIPAKNNITANAIKKLRSIKFYVELILPSIAAVVRR